MKFTDNNKKSTINLAKNPVSYKRRKHIETIKLNFLRKQVDNCQTELLVTYLTMIRKNRNYVKGHYVTTLLH